jgi:hypothetical protein
MRIVHKVMLAAAMLLSASGCAVVEGPGWERGVRTVEIEPGTGDTIITQYWTMGSRMTATYKRIPKGNTDRRGEDRPEPPAPVAD